MKELYQDTLDNSKEGETILSYTGLSDFSDLMPKEYARLLHRERAKRKIRLRVIASNSPTAQSWKNTAIQDLRDIRIVDRARISDLMPIWKFMRTKSHSSRIARIFWA